MGVGYGCGAWVCGMAVGHGCGCGAWAALICSIGVGGMDVGHGCVAWVCALAIYLVFPCLRLPWLFFRTGKRNQNKPPSSLPCYGIMSSLETTKHPCSFFGLTVHELIFLRYPILLLRLMLGGYPSPLGGRRSLCLAVSIMALVDSFPILACFPTGLALGQMDMLSCSS